MSLRLRLSIRLGRPDLTVSTNKKKWVFSPTCLLEKQIIFFELYVEEKKCVLRESEALCCKLPSPSILQLPIVIYICIYTLYIPLKFLTHEMSLCGTVKSILYTRKPKTTKKKKQGLFRNNQCPICGTLNQKNQCLLMLAITVKNVRTICR